MKTEHEDGNSIPSGNELLTSCLESIGTIPSSMYAQQLQGKVAQAEDLNSTTSCTKSQVSLNLSSQTPTGKVLTSKKIIPAVQYCLLLAAHCQRSQQHEGCLRTRSSVLLAH